MPKISLNFPDLGENAFQPKPKKNDLLASSQHFWKKEYKKQGFSEQFKQLFDYLLSAIENLALEPTLKQKLINVIEKLEKNCQTDYFKKFINEIKKQLEVITYYLLSPIQNEIKHGLALRLREVNVCPEGSFLKLQQIVYIINNQSNIFSWLADFRLEIMYRFFYTRIIKSVHTFNAILNYAQELGLNVIDEDKTTQDYLANAEYCFPLCQKGKQEFKEFFFKNYCVELIIQSVTQHLQTEIKTCVREFQQEVPTLGLVISGEIPPHTIEKKLNGLPIQELHRLIEPIYDEEGTYFTIRSESELKKEVARHLAHIDVLKKQTKKFKFYGHYYKFTIIKGDNLGDYGFISYKLKPFSETILPLSAFEEKKLYVYVSPEIFNKNKEFLRLGSNSFAYYYKKQVDFSHCYLTEIDFTQRLNFLPLPLGFKDAFFIRPKLTYKQFIYFHHQNKLKYLYNYSVDIQSSNEFFNIIAEVFLLKSDDLEIFLEHHKTALVTKGLYEEILENLMLKKIALQQQLKECDKEISRIERNIKLSKFIVLLEKLSFCFPILCIALFIGCFFFPIISLGLVGLIAGVLIDIALLNSLLLVAQSMEDKKAFFQNQQAKLKKEQRVFINIENRISGFKKDQPIPQRESVKEEKKIKVKSDNETTYYSNPTSISHYLAKNSILAPEKNSEIDSLMDYSAFTKG